MGLMNLWSGNLWFKWTLWSWEKLWMMLNCQKNCIYLECTLLITWNTLGKGHDWQMEILMAPSIVSSSQHETNITCTLCPLMSTRVKQFDNAMLLDLRSGNPLLYRILLATAFQPGLMPWSAGLVGIQFTLQYKV